MGAQRSNPKLSRWPYLVIRFGRGSPGPSPQLAIRFDGTNRGGGIHPMKKLKEPILPTPKPAGPIFPHPKRQAEKMVRQRTDPKGTKEIRVTLRDRLFVFRRLLRSMPGLTFCASCL